MSERSVTLHGLNVIKSRPRFRKSDRIPEQSLQRLPTAIQLNNSCKEQTYKLFYEPWASLLDICHYNVNLSQCLQTAVPTKFTTCSVSGHAPILKLTTKETLFFIQRSIMFVTYSKIAVQLSSFEASSSARR